MKTIPLSQGKVARVSDEDYERISQYKWCASEVKLKHRIIWYAVRRTSKKAPPCRTVLMHREIAAVAGIPLVDHRDGDGLNNQRHNLRPATANQNQQNRTKKQGFSSRYKGVFWNKEREKWEAQIRIAKRIHHLGRFSSEEAAGRRYDEAAILNFGEFAVTNGLAKPVVVSI